MKYKLRELNMQMRLLECKSTYYNSWRENYLKGYTLSVNDYSNYINFKLK